jgi:hypothetical protein
MKPSTHRIFSIVFAALGALNFAVAFPITALSGVNFLVAAWMGFRSYEEYQLSKSQS